ncbi:cell growth-regulating nucleolar protein isoform X2 [Nothobranchius furzeri]|uniref:Cell growth-regulating nucleolar protein n=1 Tax=Nothobranchius furzeri TaxID=105023 RepID=A0A9D3BFQ8_NOTFU|nr:cell growth-regulating nucleolar protein isoform X2 [Nothobranchius furzeri]KAF7208237.1 transcript variant X2 [Nothobranchius furzeri]
MVFFTCNACGESLKKAQVEKHVNMCRGCQVLSCIDCGKDFWGDDYKDHNKCISENQKYGGKGYEAKANKGDVKQQQWIQRVHEAMSKPGISAKLKDVLRQVSTYDNVPRKKAKFQNWMKNSLKINNTSLHDEVWEIISAADAPETKQLTNGNKEPAAEVQLDTNGTENQGDQPETGEKKKLNKRERKEARQQKSGKTTKCDKKTAAEEPEKDQTDKKKKNQKRKHQYEEADGEEQNENSNDYQSSLKKIKPEVSDVLMEEDAGEQAVTQGKFNWKGNIKAVLRESPDQELPVKKLRKKILAAYYAFTGDRNLKTEEDLLVLFNKKVNKNPKFRVLKDRVKLLN